MSAGGWVSFRDAVLRDPELQRVLLGAAEPEPFRSLVVEQAQALGCDVEPEDVDDALRSARRAWIERWL